MHEIGMRRDDDRNARDGSMSARGGPYREMPLRPGPPRRWRPIVERCLGLADLSVALYWASFYVMHRRPGADTEVIGTSLTCGTVALLGAVGFLASIRRMARALLILPSGALWLLVALAVPALEPKDIHGLNCVVTLDLSFFAMGLLTTESCVARLRAKRARGVDLAPTGTS